MSFGHWKIFQKQDSRNNIIFKQKNIYISIFFLVKMQLLKDANF